MIDRQLKLGSIFNIQSGGTPSRKNKDYYSDGNIPWVKTGDLKNMYLNSSKEYITAAGLNKCSAKIFPKGTVLIAMYGATIGNCSILNIDAATNQACAAFLPHEKVMPEFLYYYFKYIKQNLVSQGVGGAQPNISISKLNIVDFFLYPLNQQKQVLRVLNKVQELIDKRKAQIEALDQLAQSVFLEMFGDPIRNNKKNNFILLKDLADIIMGQSPKGDSYNKEGIGIPLLNGPTEFGDKFPKEKQWTTSPKKTSQKGDILFCVRGATAGRMNLSDKKYCIGRGLASIRVIDEKNVPFIFQTLKFLYGHFQNTSNGSTFINIDRDRIEDVPIFVLDDHLKNRYYEVVNKLEEQKSLLQQSLTELENNFQSLMKRAFRGELFPEDESSHEPQLTENHDSTQGTLSFT